ARSHGARPRCGPMRPGTRTRDRCRARRSWPPPPRRPSAPWPVPPRGAGGPAWPAAPPRIPGTTPSPDRPRPVLASGLEADDRDLPGGLLLVFGESRVGGLVRLPDLVALRAFGHPGVELHGLGADLRLDAGVGEHVVVPVRVCRGTTLGGEDRVTAGH